MSGPQDPSAIQADPTAEPVPVAEPVSGAEAEPAVGPAPAVDPGAPAGRRRGLGRYWWVGGIVIAVLVVVVLSPFASSDPDGLERVATDQGFIAQAENLIGGLLGDYAIPGVGNETVSTILSGLLGLAIVAGLLYLLGRVVTRRRA